LDIAKSLLKSGKCDACMFFCHLALEKSLKGLLTHKTRRTPPFSHDLTGLALSAGIRINKEQTRELKTITGFNIAARYDNVKKDFYKMCTREYAKKYFDLTKKWLKLVEKNYPKRSSKR